MWFVFIGIVLLFQKSGTKNDSVIKVNLRSLKVDRNCQDISIKRTLEAIDVRMEI